MTTTNPDQILLPGQAAAHPGPVDMTVMYVMHHGFRRDLRRFAEAVPATPVEDLATWRALAERWERFGAVLHEHHSGEDAGLWPFLLERADEDERETLHAMEAEHARIDPILDGCAEGFARMADADTDDRGHLRAALAVRIAEARELLAQHLRHEERDAIAILQRHTTAEEWKALEEEHFQGKADLRFIRYAVPWIAEDLPADAMARALADAGEVFRVILWIGRPGFRRLERRAFRHVAGVG